MSVLDVTSELYKHFTKYQNFKKQAQFNIKAARCVASQAAYMFVNVII